MPFWPFRREQRSISISDPALLQAWFGMATPGYGGYSGVVVSEYSALGIPAVWRAVSLISQSIAQLPLRTLRDNTSDGTRIRVSSFLDNPGGDQLTPFEWVELVLVHLLIHGNAYLAHVPNGAGAIAYLQPLHPTCVAVELHPDVPGLKLFRYTGYDGKVLVFDSTTLTHIPALSTDGLRGLSPIQAARESFGTAIAADRSAARMFGNGALISGLVTPADNDDITEDEAKLIKQGLDSKVAGWENASTIAVFNKKLTFTPWTMSAEDAQFIESRAFQIEEIARIFGIPPHALMQTDKQTSWGSGVAEQNRGLSRTVLAPWATRIEERLSRLLPSPRFAEFDFAGLERGSPAEEIQLLIQQVQAGLITVNEARKIRNMDPIPGGDVLQVSQPSPAVAP